MTMHDAIREAEADAAAWENRARAAEDALRKIQDRAESWLAHDEETMPIDAVLKPLNAWLDASGLADEPTDQPNRRSE